MWLPVLLYRPMFVLKPMFAKNILFVENNCLALDDRPVQRISMTHLLIKLIQTYFQLKSKGEH